MMIWLGLVEIAISIYLYIIYLCSFDNACQDYLKNNE